MKTKYLGIPWEGIACIIGGSNMWWYLDRICGGDKIRYLGLTGKKLMYVPNVK